jgi:hypothetical protein
MISVPVLEHSAPGRRRHLARTVRRLFSADGWLFLKAVILLALTRGGFSVCSFRSVLRLLSRISAIAPGGACVQLHHVQRIDWAIGRASHWVPGSRHCLTQALVAKVLLAHVGLATQLRIGVAKDPSGLLKAHAWLESERMPIFGVPEAGLEEYRLLPRLDRK